MSHKLNVLYSKCHAILSGLVITWRNQQIVQSA